LLVRLDWHAEYRFETSVSRLGFGPSANVNAWRKQARRVLTPGLSLFEQDGGDWISASGAPITTLAVAITPYAGYVSSHDMPMNQFSYGGMAIPDRRLAAPPP
jgi:hypothetical protein